MTQKTVHLTTLFLLWIFMLSCKQQAELVVGDSLVVLEGATLIDGTGALPIRNAVIVIKGDRIIRVGEVGDFLYPNDASVNILEGKWIIPGLIEMHAHLPGPSFQEEVLRTYVAFGVTTLFSPGATSVTGVEVRKKVASGELLGPRILTAGQAINGASFLDEMALWVRVDTENAARTEVQHQVAIGVDFIKVYAHLPPNQVRVTIDEAHKLGLKVVGHLGKTSWTEAARAGIDIIVHSALGGPTWEMVPTAHQVAFRENYLPSAKWPNDYDAALFRRWRELVDLDGLEMQELITLLLENTVYVDPNLVVYESIIWGDEPEIRERLEPDFAPEEMRTSWRKGLNPTTSNWSQEDFTEVKNTWPMFLEMVRMLHEHGVPLTAGSDLGNPWITPGPALHREFELLVSAGIANLDVLSIATRNSAMALGIHNELGTLEADKQADLVILTGNPVQDIRNTRKIETVVMQGHFYTPDSLRNNDKMNKRTGISEL